MSEVESEKNNGQKKRSRKKQLYQSILQQMEFYFSDANLAKDRFLSKVLQEKGSVDVAIFLSFNKIRNLTSSAEDIVKALRQSEKLSVLEESMSIKRNTPFHQKPDEDLCTIYVEQLPLDIDHNWVKEVFSSYGTIDYISLPKFKNGRLKGFGFIEFSTPDIAKAVIEDYKRAGNYLSCDMEPEKLYSVATFSADDAKEANSKEVGDNDDLVEMNVENVQVSSEPSGVMKKSSKRKDIEEKCPEPPKMKKQKINENEESSENDTQRLETDEDADNLEESKKKKHRKKKKKPKKDKITAGNSGLHILSKLEWKKLRNKYLNIQRQKMKNLKRHLYQNHFRRVKAQEEKSNDSLRNVIKPNETSDFPKGLIVKGIPNEPVVDKKQLKEEANQFGEVKYVDAKEGATEIFFRMATPEAAKIFCKSGHWQDLRILEGEEELHYWRKIEDDRKEKLSKKGSKERGKNKLIRKAEKALGKHIVFDEVIDDELVQDPSCT